MWKEELLIRESISKLTSSNNLGIKRQVIYNVYKEFFKSKAGQKYKDATIMEKLEQVNVCYNCYSFYSALN